MNKDARSPVAGSSLTFGMMTTGHMCQQTPDFTKSDLFRFALALAKRKGCRSPGVTVKPLSG
jgi:hypothetical protein